MSDVIDAREVVDGHYRDIVGKKPAMRPEEGEQDTDLEYKQRGQKYFVAGRGQYPRLNFSVRFTDGKRRTIKYAFITEQLFDPAAEGGKNAIIIRVQNVMQMTISGFNLSPLDEDFDEQRVIRLAAVDELTAAAALKDNPSVPVITSITLEHGRMDLENDTWIPGGGYWDNERQSWISEHVPDYR